MSEVKFKLIRTASGNKDFQYLVQALDKELAIFDGEEHAFYDQYNKIDAINHVVICYSNDIGVACGAIKKFNNELIEIKRMYVLPSHRGQGLASMVLKELEKWAFELGYSQCILETGIKQQDAIKLYKKNKYQIIENYGQYAGVENSICFMKMIQNS